MDKDERLRLVELLLAKAEGTEFPEEADAFLSKAEALIEPLLEQSEEPTVIKDEPISIKVRPPLYAWQLWPKPGYCRGGVWRCKCASAIPHSWATRVLG